jgi:hypothetical protein
MVKVKFLGPGDFKRYRVDPPEPDPGEYTFEKGRVTLCPRRLADWLVGITWEGRAPAYKPERMFEIVEGGEV